MAESTDRRLKQIVEGIELINGEIADLQGERRERMAKAKAMGYDLDTLRRVIKRRQLTPAERGEADALLETYEAALGGEAAVVPLRADAAELAAALLGEQIAGMEDPARAEALVGHVLALLDLRAEIAVLRAQESDRKKLAKGEGFEAPQIALVVRWFEKCAKHGIEAMRAGEAVFGLYRATVDDAGGPVRADSAPTADEKLAALFAKPAPKAPTKRQQALSDALALARLNRRPQG